MAALQLDLAPGWKTYWRQPGDSGLAPRFDFSQSEGVQTVEVIYPTPRISWLGGSRNIGYDTRVIFPLQLSVDNTADITLIGRVEIGVCRELCMPVTLNLSTRLSAQAPVDRLIETARAAVPKPGAGKLTCAFSAAEDGMKLEIVVPSSERPFDHAAIELDNQRLWVDTPKLERQRWATDDHRSDYDPHRSTHGHRARRGDNHPICAQWSVRIPGLLGRLAPQLPGKDQG